MFLVHFLLLNFQSEPETIRIFLVLNSGLFFQVHVLFSSSHSCSFIILRAPLRSSRIQHPKAKLCKFGWQRRQQGKKAIFTGKHAARQQGSSNEANATAKSERKGATGSLCCCYFCGRNSKEKRKLNTTTRIVRYECIELTVSFLCSNQHRNWALVFFLPHCRFNFDLCLALSFENDVITCSTPYLGHRLSLFVKLLAKILLRFHNSSKLFHRPLKLYPVVTSQFK